ncbi:hypothetical protein SISNIDRAFT_420724 [Sistotremastrum niveocremeum HHB9708]|uniref:Uncharacterized protein n=1 Tax=Sistotremastrum niveocremeum HHB9708 TaxID=1314777 RepID=A0A164MD51_9AGAM|nr:hypothetical protein SISNIDRAFT_420724 [Sistotremastrum niveocremeum HHB9708]
MTTSSRTRSSVTAIDPPSYSLPHHQEIRRYHAPDTLFSADDYASYEEHCRQLCLRPGLRAALARGGILWRIVQDYLDKDLVLGGPSDDASIYGIRFGLPTAPAASNNPLWDDYLNPEVADALCGLFWAGVVDPNNPKSVREVKYSYWPPPVLWSNMRHSNDFGAWSETNERWFITLRDQYRAGTAQPKRISQWRQELRQFSKDLRHFRLAMETVSAAQLRQLLEEPDA